MRTICCFLTLALLLGIPADARAQSDLADEAAIRKLYNDFFESFRQGGFAAAIANLRQTGSLDPRLAQTLEREFQGITLPLGPADSYAVVAETAIPNSLRFRSYLFLTYHESRPIAWRLRFYKKVTGVWIIAEVRPEFLYVEDFLRLPQVAFDAYRAVLDRVPTKEEQQKKR